MAPVWPSEIESRGTALRLYSVVEQWFGEIASCPEHCLGAAKAFALSLSRIAPPQSSGTKRTFPGRVVLIGIELTLFVLKTLAEQVAPAPDLYVADFFNSLLSSHILPLVSPIDRLMAEKYHSSS